MSNYVYKRNKDGIHYLDVSKSWEKIMIAARAIVATQAKNKQDVLVSIFPSPQKLLHLDPPTALACLPNLLIPNASLTASMCTRGALTERVWKH